MSTEKHVTFCDAPEIREYKPVPAIFWDYWTECYSDNRQRIYYFNKKTNISTWTMPDLSRNPAFCFEDRSCLHCGYVWPKGMPVYTVECLIAKCEAGRPCLYSRSAKQSQAV